VTAGERRRVTVTAGERLDCALAAALGDLSRSRVKALIEAGHVSLEGPPAEAAATITEPSRRVKPGQSFAIIVPEPVAAAPEGQALPLTILYEDAALIVIDKPAGLVVHPAPGNPDRTLVNALIAHCGDELKGIGGVRRPGIVHRLDKDTSGLMVAAKTQGAHTALTAQFAARRVGRAYNAVVWGLPQPAEGEIEGNLGRSPRNRKKMTVLKNGGKPALTRYRVLRPLGRRAPPAASLVECRLATGRTHQIRVHMAHHGHSLVGDPVYGSTPRSVRGTLDGAVKRLGRQALHAATLDFAHPEDGRTLTFSSPIPADIVELIDSLEHF